MENQSEWSPGAVPPPGDGPQESSNCRKCGGAIDTTGYPLWCKKCRAKYKREYEVARGQMERGKNFARGAEAMRLAILLEFDQWGGGSFSASEVCDIVLKMRTPVSADQTGEDQTPKETVSVVPEGT